MTKIVLRSQITPTTYDDVASTLQEVMEETGILGDLLQGRAARKGLKTTVEKMLQKPEYRAIFAPIEQSTLEADLRLMAQQLNQNHRKRTQRYLKRDSSRLRLSSPATASISGTDRRDFKRRKRVTSSSGEARIIDIKPSTPSDDVCQQLPSTSTIPRTFVNLESCVLYVVREHTSDCIMYRPKDVCMTSASSSTVRIDDMRFDKFMQALESDIGFLKRQDQLYYEAERPGDGDVTVSSEQIWWAVLLDMCNRGEHRLRFKVRQGGPMGVHIDDLS